VSSNASPLGALTASVEAVGFGKNDGMNVALMVIVLPMLFVPFVLVNVLFVWGTAKDGQEDRAVQRRLGIRRRTRLGR
jgi:urea transporter